MVTYLVWVASIIARALFRIELGAAFVAPVVVLVARACEAEVVLELIP